MCQTRRGGGTRLIPAEELVPGDIVLLEFRDKIPANPRLVEAKNLRTEEAALIGESVPADKSVDTVSEKATVGDRQPRSVNLPKSVAAPSSRRRAPARFRSGAYAATDHVPRNPEP